MSGLLKTTDVSAVRAAGAELCAEVGPHSLALCDSFAITDTMLSAPIALDWVKYNTYDNQVGRAGRSAMRLFTEAIRFDLNVMSTVLLKFN